MVARPPNKAKSTRLAGHPRRRSRPCRAAAAAQAHGHHGVCPLVLVLCLAQVMPAVGSCSRGALAQAAAGDAAEPYAEPLNGIRVIGGPLLQQGAAHPRPLRAPGLYCTSSLTSHGNPRASCHSELKLPKMNGRYIVV